VSRDLRGLQYELDIPAKFRRSFRKQTGSWLTAATAVGALIALAPMRKKKIYVDAKSGRKSQKKLVETGLALGALKIAASFVRPVIVEFVKNRLTDFAGQPWLKALCPMSIKLNSIRAAIRILHTQTSLPAIARAWSGSGMGWKLFSASSTARCGQWTNWGCPSASNYSRVTRMGWF
jgi:hypothetical protein